jgi:hypothetical protein
VLCRDSVGQPEIKANAMTDTDASLPGYAGYPQRLAVYFWRSAGW